MSILALIAGAVSINFVSVGAKNSVRPEASTTVVISQVYGGGGSNSGTPSFKNDYVELKNISSSPVSINGWSIQYGSATGQFAGTNGTNLVVLPDVTLQPGQYYLVQTGSAGTAGADFPVTPDTTSTNLSMSASSGKVALVNSATPLGCGADATPCTLPDARIIDLVGYGAANQAEGNAPTNGGSALTNTQGNVRNNNGCTDTDNNNNDFTIVTNPVPRNTATTASPCAGGGTPTPTPTPSATPGDANVDMNGDGKTDWVVTRNTTTPAGPDGGNLPKYWYISYNGSNETAVGQLGVETDSDTPEDFDGDGKDDIAVWRANQGSEAVFYIYQSSTQTVRFELFGQAGDNPRVVGDYDGDGKADPAVYRPAPQGEQGYFFYRGSANNPNRQITFVPFGTGNARPLVGDFDGDEKNDFCLHINNGGAGRFVLLRAADLGVEYIDWGLPTDTLVPGDFDGDGKDDFTVVRQENGQLSWYIRERDGGGTGASPIVWGLAGDRLAPGDYDGDAKQDVAVWRPNADPTQNYFFVRRSSDLTLQWFEWGGQNDTPTAGWYVQP